MEWTRIKANNAARKADRSLEAEMTAVKWILQQSTLKALSRTGRAVLGR